MSAYTARSLYEERTEEDEGDAGAPCEAGEVVNESSSQSIIAVLYRVDDSLQVSHVEKKKINPASSCVLDSLHSTVYPLKEYNLHIHFPGLMGMISPRTLLSSGYGFKVQSGKSYRVSLLSAKDAKGNKCSVHCANGLGQQALLDSTVYKFGDMLIRPSVKLASRVFKLPNLRLRPRHYVEYRERRTQSENQNHGSSLIRSDENVGATSASAATSGGCGGSCAAASVCVDGSRGDEIDEVEVWGLFFEDICNIGVSMCRGVHQKTGWNTDSEKKLEEGEEEEPWISKDDIELQEPYLFIGLPACSLFMTIFRSFTDRNGIVLSNAKRVVLETCPDSFKEMFSMLMVTKTSLMEVESQNEEATHLQNKDILWMQQFLLYSSSNEEITLSDCPSEERQTQFRHALSHLVGVCIQLTQQPYFKENFLHVLDDISARV